MRYMCCDCNNLEYIDLSGFNTEKVTDMSLMFYECHNLLSIDLSSFEIKDTDIHWMFLNCNSLKTVKIKENYYNKIKSQLDGFKHLNIIKLYQFMRNVYLILYKQIKVYSNNIQMTLYIYFQILIIFLYMFKYLNFFLLKNYYIKY